MTRIYFDNAATTPMAPEVVDAMLPYMRDHFGNPSAIHAFGRTTRAAVEKARRSIAHLLHCAPGEIIFTSGGTEADNMVLNSAVRDLGVKHIITSPIEHHAVESTAVELGSTGKAKIHWVRLEADGKPDRTHLEQLLKATEGEGVLVSLMHANNEIGTRIDLQSFGTLCRKYGAAVPQRYGADHGPLSIRSRNATRGLHHLRCA
jgi:cysteine desulfurase